MRKKRNYQPFLIFLLLFATAAIGWFLFKERQHRQMETVQQQQAAQLKQQTLELSKQVEHLEAELKTVHGDNNALDDTSGIFSPAAVSSETSLPVERIEQQIMAFFTYLDGREYIKAYGLESGSYEQYRSVMALLSTHPPKVAAESESLTTALGNVFHFCRIIGIKRTRLTAEILKTESRQFLESAMRLFYTWYTAERGALEGRPNLETMYQYASFFLETLGGRSYLLRRDAKIRLLSTYYCLRVVDLANENHLNSNGVDIRPLITSTEDDMQAHQALIFRHEYMAELERLAAKYPMSSQ